jgi:hypothetical protein
VYGLEQDYGDRIVFIQLDVDDQRTMPLRQAYALTQRSRYTLISPTGEVEQTWFGHLPDPRINRELGDYLETLD